MSGELSVFQRASVRSPSPEERGQDEEDEDWSISLAFSAERHTDNIEGLEDCAQNWRLKDRVIFCFDHVLLTTIKILGNSKTKSSKINDMRL